MPGPDVVHLNGAAMRPLVEAIGSLSQADVGRYAIVGGVAVAARLGVAHRVTNDLDTVVDEGRVPAAVDVLRAVDGVDLDASQAHCVYVNGTKIELLEVGPVPDGADLAELAPRQQLFTVTHAWALQTPTPLTVVHAGAEPTEVTAFFATSAALLGMKLHAIQDRSGDGSVKRRSDALDIVELLTRRMSGIVANLQQAPPQVHEAITAAARAVLVEGAPRSRAWLGPGANAGYTVEEIRHLGMRLLDLDSR